ncbi:MAG: lysylphosphatidylglycerol synthase domain-containing protein, partial [Prevotellaceae bacterium]|nr:lysylphosphatidylglycerol synthase domain-containing protein [Prevotellaceae bacterium]
QQIYTIVKWLFALAAYGYLAYKLIVFDSYGEMLSEWRQISAERYWSLLAVLALLPFNLLLEALKWKKITRNTVSLSTHSAVKAVLAGICSGFFTPNRTGDFIGRIAYLPVSYRAQGLTFSVVNSLTQNLTILFFGIPACTVFFAAFYDNTGTHAVIYIAAALLCLLLLLFFYLYLPRLSEKISSTKIKRFTDCLSSYTWKQSGGIILVSFVRYAVFCLQFFFMLYFFRVELTLWQAAAVIPANYLLVTLTPSFALSESAVRASYAVFFIGMFSANIVGIAFAGVLIWFVNTIIPMLAGSFFLLKSGQKY